MFSYIQAKICIPWNVSFDRLEIDSLKNHLRHFEAPCLEEELIQTYYRKPQAGEHGTLVTTAEILGKINTLLKLPFCQVVKFDRCLINLIGYI